jgi:hypothetical protein
MARVIALVGNVCCHIKENHAGCQAAATFFGHAK